MTRKKEDIMKLPNERKGATCTHAPTEWAECVMCVGDFYLEKLTAEQAARAALERPLADLGRLLREAGALLLDRPTQTAPSQEERRQSPPSAQKASAAPWWYARLFDLVEIWAEAFAPGVWHGRGKVFSVLKDAPPITGSSPDEVLERVLIAVLNELEAQKSALEARTALAEEELEQTKAALLVAECAEEHLDASWRAACGAAQGERAARRELLAGMIGRKEAEHDLPDLPTPKERTSPATRSAGTANMLKTFRAAIAEAREAKARAEELRALAEGLAIQKNGAYAERNELAVLVATMARALGLRSGWRRDPSTEEGWQTLVVVELPTGQVSWHLPDSERGLAEALPPATKFWGGHSKAEARQRIRDAIFKGFRSPVGERS